MSLSSFISKFTGGRSTGFDEFEQKTNNLLAQNGVTGDLRAVGGRFELNDDARAALKSTNFKGDFLTAQVVLTDAGDKAAAFMVGQRPNGEFAMVSLANIARPDDVKLMDRFDARRMANAYRNQLVSFGESGKGEMVKAEKESRFSIAAAAPPAAAVAAKPPAMKR